MSEKLNFDKRKEHLEQSPTLKKSWEIMAKKQEAEIFEILNNKKYNTGFEIRERDSFYKEKYRYFYDINFYQALQTIKSLQNKTKFHYKTIDKIIDFIKEIEALQTAIDNKKPASFVESSASWIIREADGQWKFNFFPEETKGYLTQNQSSFPWKTTEEIEKEEISNQRSRIDDYYDN